MTVPATTPATPALVRRAPAASRPFGRLAAVLILSLLPQALLARGPEPRVSIPLEKLGYQPLTKQVLLSGAAILTINYVDEKHLLVTFSLRRLLKRLPADPPTDLDRNIEAVLLEIPSGNILSRTSWRAHDLNQYLWALGDGRFLLRIQNTLTTIDPLRNLAAGDAFREQHLLASSRHIGVVLLSPDSHLLQLETLDEAPEERERTPSPGTRAYAAAAAAAANDDDPPLRPRNPNPVQINFYRLDLSPAEGRVVARSAGVARSRALVLIPADSDGFLSVISEGRQHWAFNFNAYGGKVAELSPFDSACHPTPHFVSRSEFIAFGCRSGDQPQLLGGFNLRGEEMWEQILPDSFISPAFSFAPSAGRFAFSRILATSPVAADTFVSDQLTTQSIAVFQTDSGRQIFRIDAQPILRATQNFTLSPDGSELAVVRNAVIEIYPLPPLSARDRAGLAKAASLVPPASDAPVTLAAPLSTAAAARKAAADRAAAAGNAMPSYDAAPVAPSPVVSSGMVIPSSEPDPSSTVVPNVPAAAPTAASAAAAQSAEAAAASNSSPTPGDSANKASAATSPVPSAPALTAPASDGTGSGDSNGPRKPPTLYAPGEQPTKYTPKSPK